MKLLNNLKFLFLIIIAESCHSTKLYSPSFTELNNKKYEKVSIEDLTDNRGRYHGLYVETSGYILQSNEVRTLSFDRNLITTDGTITVREFCCLWLEFNTNYPYYRQYPDSLNNRLVSIKGYFDTTNLGHVSGCYAASLTKAFDLKVIK